VLEQAVEAVFAPWRYGPEALRGNQTVPDQSYWTAGCILTLTGEELPIPEVENPPTKKKKKKVYISWNTKWQMLIINNINTRICKTQMTQSQS
jgi:hypothetical protein